MQIWFKWVNPIVAEPSLGRPTRVPGLAAKGPGPAAPPVCAQMRGSPGA